MSAALAVAVFLAAGWGAWRRHARFAGGPDAISGTALWAVAVAGAWLTLLELVGVPWSAPLLVAPAVAGVALALPVRPRLPALARLRPDGWTVGAVTVVAARAWWVASQPAFGWDFRYDWGLKGSVFALARGLDWTWLAWPGHAFAHPDYPPLWPELLAAGRLTGAPVAAVAALWQAVLVIALAAACWRLCARAARPLRALAAAAAAWSPGIFNPVYSGYADALLAFLLVVAVAGLVELGAGRRGAVATLLVVCPALVLTKNEGMVLAAGVVLAALLTAPWRRVRWVALAALVPAAGWRVALVLHGVAGEGLVLAPAALLGRLAGLPRAAVAAATPVLVAMAVAAVLALAALRGRSAVLAAAILGMWAAGVAGAFLTTPHDLTWHLAWSLDRLVAVPLPALVALALGGCCADRRERGSRWRRLARRPSETPAGVAEDYVEDVS